MSSYNGSRGNKSKSQTKLLTSPNPKALTSRSRKLRTCTTIYGGTRTSEGGRIQGLKPAQKCYVKERRGLKVSTNQNLHGMEVRNKQTRFPSQTTRLLPLLLLLLLLLRFTV